MNTTRHITCTECGHVSAGADMHEATTLRDQHDAAAHQGVSA